MAYLIKGNHKAFEEIYRRYAPSMLRFFYRRLYQDQDKAQDFLQDLFLKVIEKTDIYQPDKKFKTWLYSIASNMCKNEYRRNEIRGLKVEDYDFDLIIDDHTLSKSQGKFDRVLFNNMLAKELEATDAIHRLTFVLRYQEHLSVKEISEITDSAEGTVKSRLFYTTKKLAMKLDIFNPHKEFDNGSV